MNVYDYQNTCCKMASSIVPTPVELNEVIDFIESTLSKTLHLFSRGGMRDILVVLNNSRNNEELLAINHAFTVYEYFIHGQGNCDPKFDGDELRSRTMVCCLMLKQLLKYECTKSDCISAALNNTFVSFRLMIIMQQPPVDTKPTDIAEKLRMFVSELIRLIRKLQTQSDVLLIFQNCRTR